VNPLYGWLRTELRLLPLPPESSDAKSFGR
jgi:hypothetical protein